MSYIKQNFTNGMTLDAEHLNKMQDAIIELYDLVEKARINVQTTDDALIVMQEIAVQGGVK